VQPDEIMSDPAKESRARDLSRELRCMVCQNQSIDDSEAPLARDLRLLVRERIAAGDSDAQVMDFLVARYGEFVLLKPRLKSHTLLLWLLPPLALAGGGLVLWMQGRRRTKSAEDESLFKLSADEVLAVFGEPRRTATGANGYSSRRRASARLLRMTAVFRAAQAPCAKPPHSITASLPRINSPASAP
jgi:cytochrome c-type biogenesis protein CcmH